MQTTRLVSMTPGASLREQSTRDIESLVTAAWARAAREVTTGRWLRPIPLLVTFTGGVRELELETADLARRTPEVLTSQAVYQLAQHSTEARAVALVTGVRLTSSRQPAVEVWVEHRDTGALTLLRAHRGTGRGFRVEPWRAATGSRVVWTTPAA